MPEPSLHFKGLVYRALNPVWARDPLSGEGARRHGGRFNPKGTAALYTALSPMGAVNEANQAGRPFEPVTLVSYQADVPDVLDATNPAHRRKIGFDPEVLTDATWRITAREVGLAPSQGLALLLIELGYRGMIARSQAPGAGPEDRNLILWRWQGCLSLIDSEGRLMPRLQ